MDKIRQGDVYYVNRNYQEVGREIYSGRPAVIVTNDRLIDSSALVQVVYLTTTPRQNSATHAVIKSLPRHSVALGETIGSVDKTRLGDKIGRVTRKEYSEIMDALGVVLRCNIKEYPDVNDANAPVQDSIMDAIKAAAAEAVAAVLKSEKWRAE